MPLTTIFSIRHGYRSNWTTDPHTGFTTSNIPSPTGIASDPALSAYGVVQAEELGELATGLRPHVARIYTSPFYRCIQTIEPFANRLRAKPREETVQVVCDRGLGEWYGLARFKHPSPAPLSTLRRFFPYLIESRTIIPSPHGESIATLHDRVAYALSHIIASVDELLATDPEPRSIVLVSHAATLIAIGRALTGRMPEDENEVDFHTYTASVSRFERREGWSGVGRGSKAEEWREGEGIPGVEWRNGRGVGGGWECAVNAGTRHLSGGGERDWHFSGDEAFIEDTTQEAGDIAAEEAVERRQHEPNNKLPKL